MAHTFCCNHPQSRIDSPEPPARAPAIVIDDLLTAAALPEDHPHAFQFPDKKPAMAGGILRSPSIVSKLKSQLWRRSSRAMSHGESCDEDAKDVSEAEVEELVGMMDGAGDGQGMETVVKWGTPDGYRTPAMSDLEWLEPLVGRPCADSHHAGRMQIRSSDVHLATETISSGVPQSVSVPNFLSRLDDQSTIPCRANSSQENRRNVGAEASGFDLTTHEDTVSAGTPLYERTEDYFLQQRQEGAEIDTSPLKRKDTAPSTNCEGVHLQNLRISQQLRSLSPGSDSTDCDTMSSIHNVKPWNFYHRKASTLGGGSIHHRKGSAGIASMPSQLSVGRVRSPATSSMYSQASVTQLSGIDTAVDEPATDEVAATPDTDVPPAFDGTLPDWPLPCHVTISDTEAVTEKAQMIEPIPIAAKTSAADSIVTSASPETSTVRWSTPPEGTGSVPIKDSSSHFSVSSKRSRFFERFSPAKKLVRKRRSIFKFLRPGSGKQQGRSISSPLLHVPASSTSGAYDGPTDDPALMTVAYEMVDQPPASRSVSMGNLVQDRVGSVTHLTVPDAIQRRPSLADYERVLTAAGDDRRRPSVIDLVKLKELQEDDLRHSMSLRRRLSRAKPLDEDHTGPRGLMTQAAERNLQEKALFRSASKRREAIALAHDDTQHPLFRTDTLTSVAVSDPAANTIAVSDLLDPLDTAVRKSSIGRSHSVGYLVPPGTTVLDQASGHTSVPPSLKPTSFVSSPGPSGRLSSSPEVTPIRIGTAPAAWSRFPSHTRLERSGPAGSDDNVITRDFASDTDKHALCETSGSLKTSLLSKNRIARKTGVVKKRSNTFGGLVRYYSDVFTNGFSPANRRSSIATGGWLANPDLELLPPITSHEPTFPHHDHHFKQHLHELERDLEDQVKRDVEFVESEAVKLGEQIREDVEVVEEEAEKIMHLNPHHHREHHHRGKQPVKGPFSDDNPFAPGHEPIRKKRDNTFVSPLDEEDALLRSPEEVDVAAPAGPTASESSSSRIVSHDGTTDDKPQHKAEAWSSTYKDCLVQSGISATLTPSSTPLSTLRGMPPPQLKPAKARSPDQKQGLDPDAVVRRFPSVTVIDDCKGHDRSISLLSVKVGGDGIMQSSTNDLLQLIEAREHQERERLLRDPSRASERSARQ